MIVKINPVKTENFAVNEAYKTLRTNLLWNIGKKTICITSSLQNEGKSFVSFNLALSLVEQGKNVLFIDADIRKSVLNTRLGVSKIDGGLSEFLAGQKEVSSVLCDTNVEGLHIIFSGAYPPNPSELLGGSRFELLLTKARQEYDYIIIDTPPVGSVIDAAVISKFCDGIVMVVEAGRTDAKMLRKNFAQLEKSGCPVLGVVMNKVSRKNDVNFKKYYEGYYKEYNHSVGNKRK